MKVRKITNISDMDIAVRLKSGNVIFMRPKDELKDVELDEWKDISKYVKVEQDLTEVNPIDEKRQILLG